MGNIDHTNGLNTGFPNDENRFRPDQLNKQAKRVKSSVITMEELGSEWNNIDLYSKDNFESSVISELKSYVDQKIDTDEIGERSVEIAEDIEQQTENIFPNEKLWDSRVKKLVHELSKETDKEVKKQKVLDFIRLIDQEYSAEEHEMQQTSLENSPSKKLEVAIKYSSIILSVLNENMSSSLNKEIQTTLKASTIACGWVGLGIQIYNCSVRGRLIKEYEEKVQGFLKILENDQSNRDHILMQIELLNQGIRMLKAELNDEAVLLAEDFIKETIGTAKEVTDLISHDVLKSTISQSSRLIVDLSITGSSLALTGGVISIAFNIYHCAMGSEKLQKLADNIRKLKDEHNLILDPYQKMILSAKIDRLITLKKEYEIDLFEQSIKTAVSAIAICSSVKAVMVAAGVTLGVAASIFFTATGAGVAVLGTGLTVGGVAYAVYRKRHDIMYFVKTIDIPLRKHLNEKQLVSEIKNNSIIYEKFNKLQSQLTQLQVLIPVAEETLSTISSKLVENQEQKKIMANHQVNHLTIKMRETVGELSHIMISLEKTENQMKNLRKNLQEMEDKELNEKSTLQKNKLQQKFSRYDLTTLAIMQSIFEEGLQHVEIANNIKSLLLKHKYPVHQKVSFLQVIDFITQDEVV